MLLDISVVDECIFLKTKSEHFLHKANWRYLDKGAFQKDNKSRFRIVPHMVCSSLFFWCEAPHKTGL